MLIVPIEQEIEKERKIIKGFTIRQIVSFVLAVLVFAGIYTYTKDVDFTINVAMIPMAVILLIGWAEFQGQKAEDIIKKIFRVIVYKNTKRKYRTRNGYFDIFNARYSELRQKDMNNKKAAKFAKRREKELQIRRNASRIKPLP